MEAALEVAEAEEERVEAERKMDGTKGMLQLVSDCSRDLLLQD